MNNNTISVIPFLIVIAILLALIIFSIYMFVVTLKIQKDKKSVKKHLKAQGLIYQFETKHTYGLPLAEGVSCIIYVYGNHIDFVSGTTHISLDTGKITDMCTKTETEIQQQYVSSVGGAVAGAVLFGPLGAMIGGRAKKKTAKSTNIYLIITYKNDKGVISYLGFDVNNCSWNVIKMVNEFRQNNPNGTTHIEL